MGDQNNSPLSNTVPETTDAGLGLEKGHDAVVNNDLFRPEDFEQELVLKPYGPVQVLEGDGEEAKEILFTVSRAARPKGTSQEFTINDDVINTTQINLAFDLKGITDESILFNLDGSASQNPTPEQLHDRYLDEISPFSATGDDFFPAGTPEAEAGSDGSTMEIVLTGDTLPAGRSATTFSVPAQGGSEPEGSDLSELVLSNPTIEAPSFGNFSGLSIDSNENTFPGRTNVTDPFEGLLKVEQENRGVVLRIINDDAPASEPGVDLDQNGLRTDRFDGFEGGSLDANDGAPNATDLGVLRGVVEFPKLVINEGDEDFYQFRLAENGLKNASVTIEFDPMAGDLDLELFSLYRNEVGEGGYSLIERSNGTAGSESIRLEQINRFDGVFDRSYKSLSEGEYFLRVIGNDGSIHPDYSLILDDGVAPSVSDPTGDAFEDNDSLDNPANLDPVLNLRTLTGSRTWEGLRAVRGDDDYYRFTIPDGLTGASVSIHGFNHDQNDLDMALLHEDGTLVFDEDRPTLGASSDFVPGSRNARISAGIWDEEKIPLDDLAAGTYILHVYEFTDTGFTLVQDQMGEGGGSYALSFEVEEPPAPEDPPAQPVVIAAQNFNALRAEPTTTDSFRIFGYLTNPGATNSGGPGIDFETSWWNPDGTVRGPVVDTADGSDQIGVNAFGGTNAPDVAPNGVRVRSGVEHNFVMQDTDGFVELRLEPLDLSGYEDLHVQFSFWVSPGEDYESTPGLEDKFELWFGSAQNRYGFVSFNFSGDDLNTLKGREGNNPNWVAAASFFDEFVQNPSIDPSEVYITFRTKTTGEGEALYFDEVQVIGTPIAGVRTAQAAEVPGSEAAARTDLHGIIGDPGQTPDPSAEDGVSVSAPSLDVAGTGLQAAQRWLDSIDGDGPAMVSVARPEGEAIVQIRTNDLDPSEAAPVTLNGEGAASEAQSIDPASEDLFDLLLAAPGFAGEALPQWLSAIIDPEPAAGAQAQDPAEFLPTELPAVLPTALDVFSGLFEQDLITLGSTPG